jgi:hypothetical protein
VVREKLKRHGDQKRLEPLQIRRNGNHEIRDGPNLVIALGRDRDHDTVSGFDLFEITGDLLVRRSFRGDGDDRHARVDECDRSVLHLSSRIPFGVDIRNLLEFERSLQG